MPTIMPQSELVRRAADWLRGEFARNPGISLRLLLDEAGMRYNLSPNESTTLTDFFNNTPADAEKQKTARPPNTTC